MAGLRTYSSHGHSMHTSPGASCINLKFSLWYQPLLTLNVITSKLFWIETPQIKMQKKKKNIHNIHDAIKTLFSKFMYLHCGKLDQIASKRLKTILHGQYWTRETLRWFLTICILTCTRTSSASGIASWGHWCYNTLQCSNNTEELYGCKLSFFSY